MLFFPFLLFVLLLLWAAFGIVSGSVAAVAAILIRFTELRPIPVMLLSIAIVGFVIALIVELA